MDNFILTERWYKRMHVEPLVASCLVSRSFNAIATPRLYLHVGWPAFDTLQRCPHLLPFVQWIDIPMSKAELLSDEKWEIRWEEMRRLGRMEVPKRDEVPEVPEAEVSFIISRAGTLTDRVRERNSYKLQSLHTLVSILPKLPALRTLEVRAEDNDELWWSLMPGPLSPMAELPLGLRGLGSIKISDGGQLSSRMSARMVTRLMMLPNIHTLEVTSVRSSDWTETEVNQLRRLYKSSNVSTLNISESMLDIETLMHLLKLPKRILSLEIPIKSDTPLSAVKEALMPHAESLRALSLSNIDYYDNPRSDVLDNLYQFPALRELQIGIIYVLADFKRSLVSFLPPKIEFLQVILNHKEDEMIEIFLHQVMEVACQCPKLVKLHLLGTLAPVIAEGIEEECGNRGIQVHWEP
jgi:hypothetical protein